VKKIKKVNETIALKKQQSKSKKKNKKGLLPTIIVGHKYSNIDYIESLLLKNGMTSASPLTKEQISPKNLTSILVPNFDINNGYKQKKINHVWDGLALDLLLSNKKNKWWGWSDPNAIVSLKYWKNIDPSIFFIFTYNSPEQYLKKYLEDGGKISQKKIKKVLNDYVMYNRALLKFYYRNKKRVFLLNTQEAEANYKKSTNILQKQIGIYLPIVVESNNSQIEVNAIKDDKQDGILTFLIKNIIIEHKESNELYRELESVANLPLQNTYDKQYNKYSILKKAYTTNMELTFLKQKLQKIKEELSNESSKENELLLSQLHSVQEELEKYYLENKKLKDDIAKSKRYYGAAERVMSQLEYRLGRKIGEKSKSIIGIITLPFSLFTVKKEWEKEQSIADKNLPPIDEYADAYEAERVKKHLAYALGKTTVKTMTNPFGIFILPFKLMSTRKVWRKEREL